jgi:hypothetical protein
VSTIFAVWALSFAVNDQGPTRIRLCGTAIGTQVGFAIGGFAPTAAAWIAGDGTGGWVPVAAYVLVSSLIAEVAVSTARETFRLTLDEIDGRTIPVAPGARFGEAVRAPVGAAQ